MSQVTKGSNGSEPLEAPAERDQRDALDAIDPDEAAAVDLASEDGRDELDVGAIPPGHSGDALAALLAHADDTSAREAAQDGDADGEAAQDGDADGQAAQETVEDAVALATVLEGILFAAAEPVPLGRLARLLAPWPRSAVLEALEGLKAGYENDHRGLRLAETAAGFQLRTATECAPWVRRFFAEKPPRLSRPMLETVAIIAYRQPVTRGEIEAIRGVNCDAVLGAVVARGLVRMVGRRQSPGRPVEYGTTAEFLDLFSLRDLTDLPPLPDPAALAQLVDSAEEPSEEDEHDGASAADAESVDHEGLGHDPRGAATEDPEPGGDRLAASGRGPDPGGPSPGEREGDPRARNEG